MGNKKEYRSAVRSRQLIRQAFMDLIQEKPIDKITVTDLVRRAEINRSTFYAHYADVRALIQELENELIQQCIMMTEQQTYVSLFLDPMPFLMETAHFLEENQAMFRIIGKTDFAKDLEDRIKKVYIHHITHAQAVPMEIRNSKLFAIRVGFFVAGMVDVYLRWLWGELDCSLEEIAEDLSQIIIKSEGGLPEMKLL